MMTSQHNNVPLRQVKHCQRERRYEFKACYFSREKGECLRYDPFQRTTSDVMIESCSFTGKNVVELGKDNFHRQSKF